MKWIGLTGGIGSGKSLVANLLREQGYPVIDADLLAHKSLDQGSECYLDVVNVFGNKILQPDGTIDRKALGEIVFSNKQDLTRLENIIHPFVQKKANEARRECEANGQTIAFYDVPLLFEKELQSRFDKVLLVYATPELQKQRVLERDNLSSEDVDKRIASQISIDAKKGQADLVINNTGSIADLKQDLKEILRHL